MKLAGIILIVVGILACVYQFIPVQETKQDAQIGPLSIQHQETHYYPVTIAGVVGIVAGVACLVVGGRR